MTHDVGFHAIEMVSAGLLCRLDADGCEFGGCPCRCHADAAYMKDVLGQEQRFLDKLPS